MSRPVRDKTPTEPINYGVMGGKNPTMSVSAPKKRVSDRYHYGRLMMTEEVLLSPQPPVPLPNLLLLGRFCPITTRVV